MTITHDALKEKGQYTRKFTYFNIHVRIHVSFQQHVTIVTFLTYAALERELSSVLVHVQQ